MSYPPSFIKYNYYLHMSKQEQKLGLKFKEAYTLQMRIKMVSNLEKKTKDCVLVVIEKDEKCTKYPSLSKNMFMIGRDKTRITIEADLRKKLTQIMNRSLENESLFLYTAKTILSKDDKFDNIYEKYKDKQDGVLYLKYSSIEPF